MLGELKSSQIENVLQGEVIGRIGCHANDITYVVPVSYVYDGVYVYAHTKEGLKIEIMRANPMVCFEVDVIENMSNWRSVIAWGKFEEIEKPEERKAGMQKLIDRIMPLMTSETTPHHAAVEADAKDVGNMTGIVFRIKLNQKTGRFEKQ